MDDFIALATLKECTTELLINGGLRLPDIKLVTDEHLQAVGVDKELWRRRFLRNAKRLKPILHASDQRQQIGGHLEELWLTSEVDAQIQKRTPEPSPHEISAAEQDVSGGLVRTGSKEMEVFWTLHSSVANDAISAEGSLHRPHELYAILQQEIPENTADTDDDFFARFKLDSSAERLGVHYTIFCRAHCSQFVVLFRCWRFWRGAPCA